MSKKTRLFVIVALALTALFLLPGVSFAATHSAARTKPFTNTTVSTAFTGQVTKGQLKHTILTGGLTLSIDGSGNFTGTFKQANGSVLNVKGTLDSSGNLKITFFNNGAPFIYGQGTLNTSTGEFTGPFQVVAGGKQISSGIWSALIIANPGNSVALAFGGQTMQGPDSGAKYYGAIVLDGSTLTGTFNLPDGTIVPVSAQAKSNGHIVVTFQLGSQHILGKGRPYVNGSEKGYDGPYYGPRKGDVGMWTAYLFSF